MKNVLHLAALVLYLLLPSSLAAQPAARDQLLLVVNREPQLLSVFRMNGPILVPITALPIAKGCREVWLSPDGTRAYVSSNTESSREPETWRLAGDWRVR